MEAIIDDSIAINYRGNDRNDLMHIITNIDVKSEHNGELNEYVSPNAQKILTSEFNALFLKGNFDIDNCHGMELNSTFTFQVGKKHYDCTFLDSKFSLGAIAVLIQGRFGTALYTGYFCYYPDFSISPFIFPLIQKKCLLNYLYLDATYYEQPSDFAGLNDNVQKVVNLIETYKSKKVYIYAEKLTMDPIICELASRLSELVYVDKSRMETLKFLGYGKYFTSDINKSRISIAKGYLHKKGKTCDRDLLIVFHRHEKYTNKFLPCSYTMRNIYFFHFYCHSNHAECCRLISELKPDHLIPIQPPLIDPSKIKLTPIDFMGKSKNFDISVELTPRKGTSEAKQAIASSKARQKKRRTNVSTEIVPLKKKCPLEAVQDVAPVPTIVIEATFSLQEESPAFNTLKIRNPSEINESFELNNYYANTIHNCNRRFMSDDFSNISPQYLLPSTSRGIPALTSKASCFDTSIFDSTPMVNSCQSKTIDSLPQFKNLKEILPKLEEVSETLPVKLIKNEHEKTDNTNLSKPKTQVELISSKVHSAKQMIKDDKNSSYVSAINSKSGASTNNLPLNSKNVRSDNAENKKLIKPLTINSKESVVSAKVISSVNNNSKNSGKVENILLTRFTKSFASSEQPPSKRVRSYIVLSSDKSQTKRNHEVNGKKVIPELYPIMTIGQNINNKTNPLWADRPLYNRQKEHSKEDHCPPKVPDDNNKANLKEDQVPPKTSNITDNNKTNLVEIQQPSDSSNVTTSSDGDETLSFPKRSSEMKEKDISKSKAVKSIPIILSDVKNCNESLAIEQGNQTSCTNNDNLEHDFKNDISNCSILSIPEANASSIDRALERIMNQLGDSDSTDVSNLVYEVYDILEAPENDVEDTNSSSRVDQNLILSKTSEIMLDITDKSIDENGSISQNSKNSDIHESKLKLNNLSLTSSVQENSLSLTYKKLLKKHRIRDCYVHLNREDINRFHFYSMSRKCYVSKDYGYTRLERRRRQDVMMTNKFLGLVKKLRQIVAES